MKIALIQQTASEDNEANILKGLSNIDKAAEQGAELAVFAELAFTRFYPQYRPNGNISDLAEPVPGPTTERFMAKAKEHNMVIVLNLFERALDERAPSSNNRLRTKIKIRRYPPPNRINIPIAANGST